MVNGIKCVFAKDDIEVLSKESHAYMCVCKGFTERGSLRGFKAYYRDVVSFSSDIVKFGHWNSLGLLPPSIKDYEYYKFKADVYGELIQIAKAYLAANNLIKRA